MAVQPVFDFDSLIDFWSMQSILFHVLTYVFPYSLQRNEQGMWLVGLMGILYAKFWLILHIIIFLLNLCLW